MTLFEALVGKKPDLSDMHAFGTRCFAYVQQKQKLDPRAEEGRFIGFDPYSLAHMVYFFFFGS